MPSSQQEHLERNLGTSDRMSRLVTDHPDETIITAFAAGAAIGLAIGVMLAGSPPSHHSWRDRRVAEGIGHRLMESLDNILPDSISRTFGKD